MKLVTLSAFVAAGLLAACGGKSSSKPTLGNTGTGASASAAPISGGIHGCHFVVDDQIFNHHRCDVGPGSLTKSSGMETFTATLTPAGDAVEVAGQMDCGDMVTACHQEFTAHLTHDGAQWKGAIEPKGGDGDWWLAGSTFELDDAAGYGGATYGAGATPGE
jgi:hypothetical protein